MVVGFFPTNVVGSFSANDDHPDHPDRGHALGGLPVAGREGAREGRSRSATASRRIKLVVFKVVGYVIRLTPYAIVALTADMVGSEHEPRQRASGRCSGCWPWSGPRASLHTYALNGVILQVFADVPLVAFFRKIFPAQLTAFTTQSSIGTLPVTTGQLTRKVGVHSEIAHFTAPLGATIGMPGCAGIWPILIAVWGINAYGIAYSPSNYVVLAVLGVVVSIGIGRRARRGDRRRPPPSWRRPGCRSSSSRRRSRSA